MRRSTCVLLITLTGFVTSSAQNADPTPVTFEAASVRRNISGESNTSMRRAPGGRYNATNAPLALFITFAYQIQPFQVQGGPSWMRTDRFDIVAKLNGDPAWVPMGSGQPDPLMIAMRSLLADRFKLAVHWETQELPIYALVLARTDGKLGPNIHPAQVDCAAITAGVPAAAREGRIIDPNTADHVACGMRNNAGRFQFGGNPLSMFANGLANQVARTVVDRTGLTGNWDFEFTFTPERFRQIGSTGVDALPAVDPDGPSLFTAIQEQLGLKLESTKGPVRVLVIDHIEQPTAD
jgi:bla regulator protein blaR1